MATPLSLRLRHLGLPDTESQDLHAMGWEHYMARLSIVASGGDPGPDALAAQADAEPS